MSAAVAALSDGWDAIGLQDAVAAWQNPSCSRGEPRRWPRAVTDAWLETLEVMRVVDSNNPMDWTEATWDAAIGYAARSWVTNALSFADEWETEWPGTESLALECFEYGGPLYIVEAYGDDLSAPRAEKERRAAAAKLVQRAREFWGEVHAYLHSPQFLSG